MKFDRHVFADSGNELTSWRPRPSREIRPDDDRINGRPRDRKAPNGPGFIEGVRKVKKSLGYIQGTGSYRKGC
jgi:hypothetical protein